MRSDLCRNLPLQAAVAAAIFAAGAGFAAAQGRLDAAYAVSVAGVSVGKSEIKAEIGADRFTTSGSGRASGVARYIVSGEGSLTTRGVIKDGLLVPTDFTASTLREDEKAEVTMTIADGVATDVAAASNVAPVGRVPVTEEHRRGIVDPMSALLVGGALSAEACARTLPIFDGRHRFDLKLGFKRLDNVKAAGYRGPAVVCSVALLPIAGHRADSSLVKYLADGRDIELTLAPVAGTNVLAPFRLAIISMLGNLVIEATRFETGATAAALPAATATQ